MDKTIIKAFTIEGDLIKIARLYYDDNLNINVKFYNTKEEYELESWFLTVKRFNDKLVKLESESINLITSVLQRYKNRDAAE